MMVFSSFELLFTSNATSSHYISQKNTKKLISSGLVIAYFIFSLCYTITSQTSDSDRKKR